MSLSIDEKIEISTKRDYLVVKGNELIQKNRYKLSLSEQKTIAFICSMIKPVSAIDRANNEPYELRYEFNIRDYCKVCGINYDNGKNYADVKETLKRLSDRSMWLTKENNEILVRWLAKVCINKKSGKVVVELDKDLAPFLFALGKKFTQYHLYNILPMRSAFSVRIYEIMKSYDYQKTKTYSLDELKHLLMIEDIKSYNRFPDFRRKVLEKAQEEINNITDINMYFEPIKKGRKVIKIKFRIEEKTQIELLKAGIVIRNLLGEC